MYILAQQIAFGAAELTRQSASARDREQFFLPIKSQVRRGKSNGWIDVFVCAYNTQWCASSVHSAGRRTIFLFLQQQSDATRRVSPFSYYGISHLSPILRPFAMDHLIKE
jgi:hypothetical protein